VDRSRELALQVVREIEDLGGEAIALETDVTGEAAVDAMVTSTVGRFGGLDYAVNSAGIPDPSPSFLEGTQDDWNKISDINLKGVWLSMRAEIRQMLNGPGGGAIVNVSSRVGLVGKPKVGMYAATKHGVLGLTRSAAIEFASRGLRINAVCPGLIETPLATECFGEQLPDLAKVMNPLGRIGRPEEVAQGIAWLCSDSASFVVGVAMPIDGGAAA
jgi:NAD(P)-dependent dehydrogenase (short-subunit alcohol dehydrogenase family)